MRNEDLNHEIANACKRQDPDKIIESLKRIYTTHWLDTGAFEEVIVSRLASIIEDNKLVHNPFTFFVKNCATSSANDCYYSDDVASDSSIASLINLFIRVIRFCNVSSIDGYYIWLSEKNSSSQLLA